MYTHTRMFLFSLTTTSILHLSVYTVYPHEWLCSDVVNYFLSSKYCTLFIGDFMLLFVILQ